MEKFKNYGINLLLASLLLVALVGATLQLKNMLTISNEIHVGVALFIVCMGFLGLSWLYRKGHFKLAIAIVLVVTILIQVLMVLGLSGIGYWDPSYLNYRAIGIVKFPKDYFTMYPNTLGVYLIERGIWYLLGKPEFEMFVRILNLVNILILDIASYFLVVAIKRLVSDRVAKIAAGFTYVLIVLSPWVTFFYSDNLAFLISSILLLIWSYPNNWKRNVAIGVVSGLAYFIKPSLVIFLIALILQLISECWNRIKLKLNVKILIMMCIPFLLILLVGNGLIKTRINTQRSFDAWQFMAMGLSNQGGYNYDDVLANKKIPDKKQRRKYNQSVIKSRLNSYGIRGYLKFLLIKQVNNTNKGTFGWGDETDEMERFITPFSSTNKVLVKVKNIYLDPAKDFNGLAIINQLIWIALLLGTIISLSKTDIMIIPKLTVIGFMLFLLLFEGGRSRYVIQYLPYLMILGADGIDKIYQRLRSIKIDSKS